MRLSHSLALAAVVALSQAATPALADPGRDGKGRPEHVHGSAGHCPPGLAKKNPPCLPPGQARKSDDRFRPGIGDVLRVGDYAIIRDPRGLNLEPRGEWRYYRDGDRAYRVDRDTRQILAVIQLIDAFAR